MRERPQAALSGRRSSQASRSPNLPPPRSLPQRKRQQRKQRANHRKPRGHQPDDHASLEPRTMRPSFTLGIEEEYQTVDPVTRDLRSDIKTELLSKGKRRLEERGKAEMHQSVVEVGTRICRTIIEACDGLYDLRRQMIHIAQEHGLVLVAGAT